MIDKWLTLNEIAGLLSRTKGPIIRRAKLEGWPYRSYVARGGKERRYHLATLPEDVQAAYAASIKTSLDDLKALISPDAGLTPDPLVKPWKDYTDAERDTARMREKVILTWKESGLTQNEFCASYTAGHILSGIRSRLGERLSDSTLSRWVKQYTLSGVAGLAPRYERYRGGHGASLDEHTKGLIKVWYLRKNKPSLRNIHRTLREQEDVQIDYSVLCRYVRHEIDQGTKDFFRKGEKYYRAHHEPYIDRDYTRYHPMQVVVSDHKTFDFVSRVKRADGWHVVRLSLTCITDMRSRKILGWCIDEVPSTLTIIRAVKMMVEQHGCPEVFLVDNGKDFSSYWFAGNAWNEQHRKFGKADQSALSCVTGDLGAIVQFCTPYRGQSKPIERFFGFVSQEHDKSYDSYTGSNTSDRIDDLKLYWGSFDGKQKIPTEELPTIDEVRTIFARFVARYNATWRHSGQGMDNSTPDTIFDRYRKAPRLIPEEYKKYVWTRREIHVVQRNGVKVGEDWYFNAEMALIIGQKVEIRISIDDIGVGYIFDLKTGSYMYDADCNVLKDRGIKEENVRNVNRLRRAARKHIEKSREAMDEIRKDRKTQLEELREQENSQVTLKVVGGEDLPLPAGSALTLVGPEAKPKRKIKGLFDPD
ncbi:MAG: DDE-type integrase/transposase/recombinase [Treponema sp.]|jgi:putative transposase|nr:DDE-type integrase/transposase/recombinase [Treponema sp.]